ncbi:MAG: hypothetical protein WCE53_11805 [Candidatus Acidiferrum sp.]
MATGASTRVDWKLLWAQRGFRYFFTAMFVSLFGSSVNSTGVSRYGMSAAHLTAAVSWQLIETDFLCAGIFSAFHGCFGKRKNFLDTSGGKSFAGGVPRS